jgi:hypothetical protein
VSAPLSDAYFDMLIDWSESESRLLEDAWASINDDSFMVAEESGE